VNTHYGGFFAVEQRLIVEQFDPELPKPGGIDTCIRGLIRYCPPHIKLRIAGVDAIGNKRLGEWAEYDLGGGRTVEFMPLVRLDHSNLKRSIPHSVRVAIGLRRYRPAPDADVVQAHRINLGATAMRLYPRAAHVQFLHWSGEAVSGNESFFRRAMFAYRWLERSVLPRTVDTVVFSKAGADRLRKVSDTVRFSPTWYDPLEFYPSDQEPETRNKILWACRIEPPKNPELAVEVMARLPKRYSLTVAGSGTMEPLMRALAGQSPAADRINFLGAVPKSEIGAVMRSHHLMLMTSRFEGFSRAIVEGLATGLPVVTTPGGEPNGLVKTGVNGARVDGDMAELFPAAIEIAAGIRSADAQDSVRDLSAANVVPNVLNIPDRR
jgi:glycosyltransferase involved in cell wall biosynthesis